MLIGKSPQPSNEQVANQHQILDDGIFARPTLCPFQILYTTNTSNLDDRLSSNMYKKRKKKVAIYHIRYFGTSERSMFGTQPQMFQTDKCVNEIDLLFLTITSINSFRKYSANFGRCHFNNKTEQSETSAAQSRRGYRINISIYLSTVTTRISYMRTGHARGDAPLRFDGESENRKTGLKRRSNDMRCINTKCKIII